MNLSKSKFFGVLIALGLLPVSAFSQSMLQQYLDTASAIVPNQLKLSLYEEVKYNDNIHNSSSDEEDSMIFKTGARADIFRTKGNLTYGLQGDVSYDWYTRDSDDMSAYDWNLSPYLQGNLGEKLLQGLMISLKSRSVYEPYSKRETRYVRHFENGVGLAYDYSRHERWGVISTFQYTNYYYPQSSHDYSSSTNNKYKFAIAPYYKVTEKVRTGLHLGYEIVDYRNDKKYDDSDNISITGFVDYRANMFLNMTAEAGMKRYNYDGRSKGSVDDRDFEPVFLYTLRYIPSKDWTLSYMLRYEPEYGSDDRRRDGAVQRDSWH